jgi:hypothetical protein
MDFQNGKADFGSLAGDRFVMLDAMQGEGWKLTSRL